MFFFFSLDFILGLVQSKTFFKSKHEGTLFRIDIRSESLTVSDSISLNFCVEYHLLQDQISKL